MSIYVYTGTPSTENEVQKIYLWEKERDPWVNTIAYYPFKWDSKDYSGNWHDLTKSGSVSYVTLNWRQVVYMQWKWSSNTTKLVSSSFSRTISAETYSIWCRTNANATSGSYINAYCLFQFYQNTSPYNRQWIFTSRWNNRNYHINYWVSLQDTWIIPDIWDDTFHLITVTTSQSAVKLYVDWELKYTWTGWSPISCSWKIYVGSNYDSYYWFNGYIWDTILEDKEWTAKEISDYYNQTKSEYWIQ